MRFLDSLTVVVASKIRSIGEFLMGKKMNAAKVEAERAAQMANAKVKVMATKGDGDEVVVTRPPKDPCRRIAPGRQSLLTSSR